jgi:hypothetical protein
LDLERLNLWGEWPMLVSATLNMGVGDKLDRAKTNPLPAGSAAVIQVNANHFSWTGEQSYRFTASGRW